MSSSAEWIYSIKFRIPFTDWYVIRLKKHCEHCSDIWSTWNLYKKSEVSFNTFSERYFILPKPKADL